MMRQRVSRSLSKALGFSLVELMVGMTIGLALTGGLLTLFSATSNSGNELDKSIRQIENGRYAVELLSEDISVAGYFGELSTGLSKDWAFDASTVCATPITVTDNFAWNNTISMPKPVVGLSAAQADALTCLPNRKPGTVALVVHRLDIQEIALGDAVAGTFYVQTSRCSVEDIDDATYPRFIASSTLTSFTLTKADCVTKNTLRKYINRIYYVSTCDECAIGVADTIPTLKRAELVGNAFVATPLVEGIDDIAFDFGVDTNDDGLPDQYLQTLSAVIPPNTPPNPLADWSNVMAVRMYVLSRTTEISSGYTDGKTFQMGLSGTRGPFIDNYKRRLSTVTARLNNPAGVRE